jgi:predicted dithiol-disulfide oxidoreductase (DUF899 family)
LTGARGVGQERTPAAIRAAGLIGQLGRHGTNVLIRDGDRVFRAYFINSRGDEALGSTWSYLDITAPDGSRSNPAWRLARRH